MLGVAVPTLSIVIPVYNEEAALPKLFAKLMELRAQLASNMQVIFVDNCSTDSSRELILEECRVQQDYQYIRFSRNFGPTVEASITAGYRAATGDAIVVLYSDLQDPPELILDFERLWLEGYDVVYGQQTSRNGEPLWRRTSVRIFYRRMEKMAESPVPANAGDFRLISRRVRDALLDMGETARYTRGLVAWVGYRQTAVPYARAPRDSGKSKANFFAVSRTAMTAVTSFSMGPLRMLTAVGAVMSAICFLLILGYAVMWLLGQPLPGLTTVITLILFSAGANFAALGLIGEYIGRITTEVKHRPLYIVAESANSDIPLGVADIRPRFKGPSD